MSVIQLAVGSPDDTGWPRIRASIRRIEPCARCGLRLPTDHLCATPQAAAR